MAAEYRILATQPFIYQDQMGQVINGFRVFFEFPAFNETHSANVPNLQAETVKKVVEALLADRKNLAKL